jgi:hypothetical protein
MIRRTDITVDEILRDMVRSQSMPDRVGAPMSAAERAAAAEAVARIVNDNSDNIRTVCVGCGDGVPLRLSAPCQCGGFVCVACQRLEEDGTCDHVPLVNGVDEDDKE